LKTGQILAILRLSGTQPVAKELLMIHKSGLDILSTDSLII